MTNKEAVDIIKEYDTYSCGYCHQGGDEVEEAFNVAIKALEIQANKPPTDDWEEYADTLYDKAYEHGWNDAKES